MFEHSRVLVAGGSSGVGLAAAAAFAARGAHVAIVGRDLDRLSAAQAHILSARSIRDTEVRPVRADLTDEIETRHAVEALFADGFVPDVVVNAAGTILPGEFAMMSREDFESNFSAGFWGLVHVCRAVVPYLVAAGRGHIVNVCSIAGFVGVCDYTGYAASKHAVMGFTEALRSEMRPHGVALHIVCPSDIDRPGVAGAQPPGPHERDAVLPSIQSIPPEQVAESIVRGVERNRYLIIPDATSRFYLRLKGLVPEALLALIDSGVREARRARRRS